MKRMIRASYDDADTYIVSIWHEVEANAEDTYGPEADQEIFEIVATSPEEAIEIAKDRWQGPIDRIDILDVNPDAGLLNDEDFPIPFEASTDTQPRPNNYGKLIREIIPYLMNEGVSEHDMLMYFFENLPSSQTLDMMYKLAEECDIELD